MNVRPARWGLALVLVLSVSTTVAACRQATAPTANPSRLSSQSSVAIVSPAGDPCANGPAGCLQVGAADVDGDGQLDRIGVAVEKRVGQNDAQRPGVIFVRVANSHGVQSVQADAMQLPEAGSPTSVFVGAFLISRARGADLVIMTRSDFLTQMYSVISWSHGTLTQLAAPPSRGSIHAADQVWKLTQSEGFRETVICTDGTAVNMVHDVAPISEGIPEPGGGRRETSRYSFINGEWVFQGFQSTPKDQFSYDESGAAFLCGDQRR